MASPYNPGQRNAVALGLAMGGESSQFAAGSALKVTSQTTLVITHGLTGTPTFLMVAGKLKAGNLLGVTADSTSVTVTRTTATSSWTVSYIAGVIV